MNWLEFFMVGTVVVGAIAAAVSIRYLIREIQREKTPAGKKTMAANCRARARELLERAERLEREAEETP